MHTPPLDESYADQPPEDAVDDPKQRTLILIAMCLALMGVIAAVSGLNVATQELAIDFGATQSDLLWIINGYTIALAALLLPIGAIGDRWGRKKVLLIGLTLFIAANLASAFATGVPMLLGLRVLAGVAAAMIMPVTLSVVTSSFPPEDRDRAIGVWAGVAGAGGILGLFYSSIMIDNFSWQWVFALPVVVAVSALVMTAIHVPHSHEHHQGRFDVVGSILSALAVGGLVLGIHEGPEAGWTAPLTVASLIVGAACAVGFVVWELAQDHPLLNLRVFKNRMLASGSFALLVTFAVMTGLFLVVVQYLQIVLEFSAVGAAAGLLPMAAVLMPLSAVAPLIARRVGTRAMFVMGGSLGAVGLIMMALMASIDGGYFSVLPGLLILAAGIGVTMTPGTTAITAALPQDEQGVASALNDTVREFGAAVGIALLGSVMAAGYSSAVRGATAGLPEEAARIIEDGIGGASVVASHMGPAGDQLMVAARQAFLDGWTGSMWVSAAMGVGVAVACAFWTPSRARERAMHSHLTAPDAVDAVDTVDAVDLNRG